MIPLSAVHKIELRSSMVLKSPKIRIYVYVGQHGRPAPGTSLPPCNDALQFSCFLPAQGGCHLCVHAVSRQACTCYRGLSYEVMYPVLSVCY